MVAIAFCIFDWATLGVVVVARVHGVVPELVLHVTGQLVVVIQFYRLHLIVVEGSDLIFIIACKKLVELFEIIIRRALRLTLTINGIAPTRRVRTG